MSAPAFDYTPGHLASALRSAGVGTGDIVFVHADLGRLGHLGPAAGDNPDRLVCDAIRGVIGPAGTLLVPTYTFSFCRQESFDVQHTPTVGGPWSPSASFLELVRALPGAIRSADPIHAVAGVGPRARELLEDVAPTCFGQGSVFERLRRSGAKVCLLGLGLEEATIRHHAEEEMQVPFRFRKLFTGTIVDRGVSRKRGWIYSVRILAENGFPDGRRLEAVARERGICRAVPLGRGELLAVDAAAYDALTRECLATDPWFTARGPAADPVQLETVRVGACVPAVTLPARAPMRTMVKHLWRLPRDIVSDGYDAALGALAEQVPMQIHRYPTGMECWTWIVPEAWTCREAYLETMDGRRLFSYADNPLHVVSYSLPFEGEVSRDELLAHLHAHPILPDAIPFVFKYYERDWGLCCSRRIRDTLTDDRYRVVIRSNFRFGELKVGEVVARGRSEDSIVLCAHLCHPAMVNDDLSGIVVGMEVMRRLLARQDLRYTYRLLVLPETIGSIAYLSRNEHLVDRFRGGLFLEMLGLPNPPALQLSLAGDTHIDRCFREAVVQRDPQAWSAPFRQIIGNDERQFNAPGVRVPMLSLSRVRRMDDAAFPYPEYHSSADDPAAVSWTHLEDSVELVLAMIERLEASEVPRHRFKGEVFCSRYGLHVDPYANPDGHRALFDIMYLIDGTRSVADIAAACGIPPTAVEGVVEELRRHGLVDR